MLTGASRGGAPRTSDADNVNILGRFLGMRDVPALDAETLRQAYGFERADVMVLFGGSVLAGGDVFARAMRDGVARTYIIVGGEGHTTEALRQQVRAAHPSIPTEGLPEAEVFRRYLKAVYGLAPDLVETRSTNCGNNITNLLRLIRAHGVPCRSVILCQDATMQRRMDAGMRKHAPEGLRIVNFASYSATVACEGGALRCREDIRGMWDMERYIGLLMGEIPRLTDDENGYGPRGKGFIAHVDIPPEVSRAFGDLKASFGDLIRK